MKPKDQEEEKKVFCSKHGWRMMVVPHSSNPLLCPHFVLFRVVVHVHSDDDDVDGVEMRCEAIFDWG